MWDHNSHFPCSVSITGLFLTHSLWSFSLPPHLIAVSLPVAYSCTLPSDISHPQASNSLCGFHPFHELCVLRLSITQCIPETQVKYLVSLPCCHSHWSPHPVFPRVFSLMHIPVPVCLSCVPLAGSCAGCWTTPHMDYELQDWTRRAASRAAVSHAASEQDDLVLPPPFLTSSNSDVQI